MIITEMAIEIRKMKDECKSAMLYEIKEALGEQGRFCFDGKKKVEGIYGGRLSVVRSVYVDFGEVCLLDEFGFTYDTESFNDPYQVVYDVWEVIKEGGEV